MRAKLTGEFKQNISQCLHLYGIKPSHKFSFRVLTKLENIAPRFWHS